MWRKPGRARSHADRTGGSRHYRRRVLFGGHVGGGVKAAPERAEAIGADALQLFVQSPRAWRFPNHDPEVLERFEERARRPGSRRRRPRDLPLQPREPRRGDLRASRSRRFARPSTRPARSRPTVSSSTSARISAPASRPASSGRRRRSSRSLERCSDTTWLLIENSAGTGGTIGPVARGARAARRPARRAPAPRRLPRFLPPVGLRRRRDRRGGSRCAPRRVRRG